MALVALEAYGLFYKDAKSMEHISLPEMANALKHGFIDVAFVGGRGFHAFGWIALLILPGRWKLRLPPAAFFLAEF